MFNENDIRKLLAERLEVLEPGLTLVAQEYALPNSVGAAGRVDILAKDRLGNFVVVELKKSNASARTALHELVKYLALFKATKGLPSERLRCILVSTAWGELLTPFSELVHNSPWSLHGRKLEVDEDGVPIASSEISPLSPNHGLQFPDHVPWLVCATREARDGLADSLMAILPAIGLRNVLVISMTANSPERLPYPFGVAVPFFLMSAKEADHVLSQSRWPVKLLADYADVPRGGNDFCIAVEHSVQSKMFCLPGVRDVHDVALATFRGERQQWTVELIRRHGGPIADPVMFSDEDLLRRLDGLDGSNDLELARAVDPSHPAQLASFMTAVERRLAPYGWWEAARDFVDDVRFRRGATLIIEAYCPTNLLLHIAMFLRTQDVDYLPTFRLLVVAEQNSDALLGRLSWPGEEVAMNAQEVLAHMMVMPQLLPLLGSEVPPLVVLEQLELEAFTGRFGEWRESRDSPPMTVTDWADHHRIFSEDLLRMLGMRAP